MKKEIKLVEAEKSRQKVFEHFQGDKLIKDRTELKECVMESALMMTKQISDARSGVSVDEDGNRIKPIDLNLNTALEQFYGLKDEKASDGKIEVSKSDKLLQAMGIYKNSMTLHDVAKALKTDISSVSQLEQSLINHGTNVLGFDGPRGTDSVPNDFRFLISELILDPIRTNYLHTAMHMNWIAGTRQVDKLDGIIMPQIRKSNALARRIGEGSAIPIGTTKFGQKSVNLYKIGVGMELTEELILQSALSDMTIFMQDFSSQFALGSDNEALTVLLNGEQSDMSESAPEIGVDNTTTGIDRPDMIRVATRMNRLGLGPNYFITTEAQSTKNIVESGTTGNYVTPITFMRDQAEVGVQNQSVFNLAANKSIFLNSARALLKLQFGSLRAEQLRDPETQSLRLFLTYRQGFVIVKRDARVVVNGGTIYNATAGQTGAFPTYMDIDSEINTTKFN